MLHGKAPLVALIGLGCSLAGVAVFLLARQAMGEVLVPALAGGFVALVGPVLAVILLLPRLLAGDEEEPKK